MFTITEPPREFDPLNERCRALVAAILERISIPAETIKLRSGNNLYEASAEKKYIYVLREGTLSYSINDRTLFYFQEGDMLGFEQELDVFTPRLVSDFATILERYPLDAFLKEVRASNDLAGLWQEFLGRYIALLYVVARSLFKEAEPVLPEVRNYAAGATIIEADSLGDEVFTLADGVAVVMREQQEVGSINSDEVFGLTSALTETPRPASVVATTDCLVLVMKKQDYLELILSRPSVMQRILLDMSQTIVDGQKQLAGAWLKL
jgi:CRP-like cAMP-binding protein